MQQNQIMRHVMIDLETMGLNEDAAIVSIGAVLFDPLLGKVSKSTFYSELDWENQKGRKVDPGTQSWWKEQSPEARESLHGLDDLEETLIDLAEWLPRDCKVWGNGPTFDISKLEHAYRQFKQEIPWKYWNVHDCRTVKLMYESARGGFDKKSGGTLHNALNDAQYQAWYICKMWAEMIGNRKGGKVQPISLIEG